MAEQKDEKENRKKNKKRKNKSDIVMSIMIVVGLALHILSYMTGYYVFGQMHSVLISICLLLSVAAVIMRAFLEGCNPEKEWPWLFMTSSVIMISWSIGMIMMDRVEAVGNCVVTDFDSGHGGEEAVYISMASVAVLLLTILTGIVRSFGRSCIRVVEEHEEQKNQRS